jgi:homoserine O-acetyltransferase
MRETHIAAIGDLPLRLGGTLKQAEVAYVTYGRQEPGRPAILLTHGYTSPHTFAEAGAVAAEGSWSALVGPGRPVDTDRFFVVSANMIGSSFGSTAPASIDPGTGRPYGPDFPQIVMSDMVESQRRLLDRLGVGKLAAVVGPSYGGFQALQWARDRPHDMDAIVVAVSGLTRPDSVTAAAIRAKLSADPNWNGGHYYDHPYGIRATMTALREEVLLGYGIEATLEDAFPSRDARLAEVRRMAQEWADAFDGNSLVALAGPIERFRPGDADFARIRARVLLALSSTDALYPASEGPAAIARLKAAGVDARFVAIESGFGHLASGLDHGKWSGELAAFLAPLAA